MSGRRVFMCLVITVLAFGSVVLAKGRPDQITITGPGIGGVITIYDEEVLEELSMLSLEAVPLAEVELPPDLGEGYDLTRYYQLEGGSYRPFDHVRYHLDPHGGLGYVQYVGIINGWSEYDGDWFRASESADAILQRLLTADNDRRRSGETLLSTLLDLISGWWAALDR